jgi:glyoxylase-like metal-dependent hydrolase (beta-lactamase superfamily II)
MCLGHTSPGRPGSDELVPSRYALRVGEIDVLVISDGALALSAAPFATNVEPAALKSWLDNSFLPLETFPWANNALVVRSGGQTILIDSGVGAAYPDFPQAGRLAVRLEAAGIDPGSVTDAVITHMHMDHVGGLLVDGLRSRLRPDLRVHVAAAEVEFWESPDFSHTDMPQAIPDVLRKTAGRFVDAYRSELRLFDKEHMVAPGVLVRHTGGHTAGHSVVRLASGGHRLTFVGDAVFPVGFDRPEWHNGFDHDPETAVQVRLRLLREMAGTGELLVGTHLTFPSLVRVAADGDVFRSVPAYWEY